MSFHPLRPQPPHNTAEVLCEHCHVFSGTEDLILRGFRGKKLLSVLRRNGDEIFTKILTAIALFSYSLSIIIRHAFVYLLCKLCTRIDLISPVRKNKRRKFNLLNLLDFLQAI